MSFSESMRIGAKIRISFLAPFILSNNIMEKGISRNESQTSPCWSMHQDLQDVKMGLKTFDDLRLAWVAWAREALKELEGQADKAPNAKNLPDPKAADTTA